MSTVVEINTPLSVLAEPVNPRRSAIPGTSGLAALRAQFPARPVVGCWPATAACREDVVQRVQALAPVLGDPAG
jgi:hypothetical protein